MRSITMQYPLQEKIGNPDLMVGREKEFKNFHRWIDNISKKLSKSRVILARRKSGKTAFIQRLFNQLWSAGDQVIPFYFDIAENNIWFPMFSIKYFCSFATQYISFLEREPLLIQSTFMPEQIRDYGVSNNIQALVQDVDSLLKNKDSGFHDLMWETAYSAPHRFAALHDIRFLVIIDEFQNITQYVYRDEACAGKPDETLAGSFHYHVESKIAPMLVTGSYIRWLINISSKYLEAGRLTEMFMSPYITEESGLEAVYRYADAYDEPITNDTAILINTLCMSDPFFISCVIQTNYDNKDLTTEKGVIETVNHEITHRYSEMSRTWGEYIQLTLQKVNDRNAKEMLLFLSKHSHRYWTPKELKSELGLDISVDNIHKKLLTLVEADVLEWGNADIDFRGLQDGTLNLILRNRFEKEILSFEPDLKKEFHEQIERLKQDKEKLQGMLNRITGEVAEMQIANAIRSKKRFKLSRFFDLPFPDIVLNIVDVRLRVPFQRNDGKNMELDVVADSSCGRVLLMEVKKKAVKTGFALIENFIEKTMVFKKQHPEAIVLPAFLSLGGFTGDALDLCSQEGIAVCDTIKKF
ncbi:MAG: hypothetical protein HQK66_00440 [Desulfamplus sp.]|nr:hypothetical protein [Desulfamplus sp.]